MSENIDLADYVPSEAEEFMNPRQRAYFRSKLVAWKNEILREARETLDHLAERLGLEEARSFATLLQQSEKLGSSLTEALRVYSDDMRHQRLSRAEEKAYSLPAKLSVPLTLCVFPVVIIVIMLPVYVRFKVGNY